jgi:hypothetical protein
MPAAAEFRAVCGADVALVAATAKCVLGIDADANRVVVPTEFSVGFDATVATREAVVVEFCAVTWATNAPGTNSTSVTPVRIRGPAVDDASSAARAWSSEPTVVTPLAEWLIEQKSGVIDLQQVLGREKVSGVGEGFVIRCTSPDAVNARAYISYEVG